MNQIPLLDLKHRRSRRPRRSKLAKTDNHRNNQLFFNLLHQKADQSLTNQLIPNSCTLSRSDSIGQTPQVLTVAAAYASQLPAGYVESNEFINYNHDPSSISISYRIVDPNFNTNIVSNELDLINSTSSMNVPTIVSNVNSNSTIVMDPNTVNNVG